MKRKSDKLITGFLVLVLAVGIVLLVYPTFSDYWNALHQTRAVSSYGSLVDEIDESERDRIWAEAQAYNEELLEIAYPWVLSDERRADYESQLAMDDTGIMGYVDIPKIQCTLPIYHGTDESVLQTAVGHIEGSSLPVGGPSTHSVISGHRGLPSVKLFTNLDELAEGDVFMLRILGEVLTYEVDQIRIVEPDMVDDLAIVEGEDYCTLVTCTPYGVNSHRLLVRGHHVDNIDATAGRITADAILVDPDIVSACLALPMLLVLFVAAMAKPRKRGRD